MAYADGRPGPNSRKCRIRWYREQRKRRGRLLTTIGDLAWISSQFPPAMSQNAPRECLLRQGWLSSVFYDFDAIHARHSNNRHETEQDFPLCVGANR
jgi:hypothetical protein